MSPDGSAPEVTECRSCGATVLFATSAATGRTMILDAKPAKRVVLELTGLRGPPGVFARVVDTYLDHHATCPQAAEWRGRRRDPE